MKYLVASDIHGSKYFAFKVIEEFKKEKADFLILLGDIYYHGPRNPLPQDYNPKAVYEELNKISDRIIAVRGNCDSEVDQMVSNFKINENVEMNICGKKYFFTHGHKINKDNFSGIDFDVMMYGHFHTGFIKQENEKIFVNTGSVTLPKQNTENSFVIIDDDNILLKNFSGKIIDKLK